MTAVQTGQVTGRYAGPVTRLAAFAVDAFMIVTLYGLIIAVLSFTVQLIAGYELDTGNTSNTWWLLGYVLWFLVYFWASTAITGRTIGKWLVGLRIVEGDGSPLQGRPAFVRAMTFPLSFILFGLGFVGIVVGKQHRALHDVFAGTVVVYDWGDRPAEMPAPLTRYLSRRQAIDLPQDPGPTTTASKPANAAPEPAEAAPEPARAAPPSAEAAPEAAEAAPQSALDVPDGA